MVEKAYLNHPAFKSLIRLSVEAILYVTIPKTPLFLFFISDSFLMADRKSVV